MILSFPLGELVALVARWLWVSTFGYMGEKRLICARGTSPHLRTRRAYAFLKANACLGCCDDVLSAGQPR